MRSRFFLILFLQIWAIAGFARFNPFELRHRLTQEELQQIAYSQRNPFDLIRGEEAAEIAAYLPSAPKEDQIVKAKEDRRYLKAPGVLFWVYLVLFVLLSFLINLGRHQLVRMIRGIFNDQLSLSLLREKERSGTAAYLTWYLFFFVNAGIFLFQAGNWWTNGTFPGDQYLFMVWISFGVICFYLLKHAILYFIGSIFPLQKPMHQYSFSINLSNALLGLALFPINVGISYSDGTPRDIFLFIGFSIVAISYIFRILRGLWIGLPYLVTSPIHFFLYICAVEMAPVLILVKSLGVYGLGS